MSLIRQLSVLAVCQVLGDRADSLMGFLGERFHDHSGRLERALANATERAWGCLDVALAGDSWLETVKSALAARDEQALRAQIRLFLASIPAAELPGDAVAFRRMARAELDHARKAGLVPGGGLAAPDVAGDHQRVFARYGDPQSLVRRDQELVAGMAALLVKAGYPTLGRYVGLRPPGGQPLLVQAVRYFFRREVEADAKLAAGLTMEKLDGLDAAVRAGMAQLHQAFDRHGALLGGMAETLQATHQGVAATMEVVTGTHDEVKTLRAQMEQQQEQLRQLTGLMERMLAQKPADPVPAKPAAGLPRSPLAGATAEWGQVRELLARVGTAERPDLSRLADKLTRKAEELETTRRTILRIEHAEAAPGPLPVYPGGGEILDALPADEPPKRRPAAGRLISPLFQNQPPKEEPEAAPPTAKPTRRRYLSPLFDPKPEDEPK